MAKKSANKKAIMLASGRQFEVTKEDDEYYYTLSYRFHKAAKFYKVIERKPPKKETKPKIAEEGGEDNADATGNK